MTPTNPCHRGESYRLQRARVASERTAEGEVCKWQRVASREPQTETYRGASEVVSGRGVSHTGEVEARWSS